MDPVKTPIRLPARNYVFIMTVLDWLILTVTAATAVLAIVVLFRLSKGLGEIGKGVRDELREGREETRSAGKELREEVSNGLIRMIDNPDVTIEELMEDIKAPDFPTGGTIYGYQGVKDAFETVPV